MKCAIYTRYSSDLKNDRSIDDQVRNCVQYAERLGWTVLDGHLYTDRAVSGTTLVGRSGLADLMKAAAARPGAFDYVLIDDTSRLSRDKIEQAELIRDLREYGVHVYFVSDGIDTKSEIGEDIILPIYGIKDSLYCRDLARKTKRGMAGQALKGFNPGGRLYGYDYHPIPDPSGTIDKKTRNVRSLGTKIEIDQVQAMVVRMIFSMFASGYGLKAIAAKLNEQGIDPPGKAVQTRKGIGRPSWCPNAIRSMLRNPRYIGDWTWNKFKWVRRRKTGRRMYTPRLKEEWVEFKNDALAIVDLGFWNAVQSRITENKHKYKSCCKPDRSKHLMSGLLKCGICGARLIVVSSNGGKKVGYRCSFNWHRGAAACPNNVTILKSDIEARVLSAIRDRILNPDFVTVVVSKVNQVIREKMGEFREERLRLTKKREEISQEIQNLVGYVAKYGKATPSIQKGIEAKEAELSSIEFEIRIADQNGVRKELTVKPEQITEWLNRLDELICRDITAAKAAIQSLIGELTATPANQDGSSGLMLTGKPKIDGVLGVIGGASTKMNSGGRI